MQTGKMIEEALLSVRLEQERRSSTKSSSFAMLSDQTIVAQYDSIRLQVEADEALGGKHRLVGEAARMRAEALKQELISRGIGFLPIRWP